MNGIVRRLGTAMLALASAWPVSTAFANPVQLAQSAPPTSRAVPRAGEDHRVAPNPANQSAQAPSPPAQAPAPPPVPTRTEILNFENWVVTCNEFAEGARTRVCSAALQILQPNTNQVVFNWSIGVDNSKQMISVMQTPTGVQIAPGVELRVGKAPARKIPFATCDAGRCVATTTMDTALLREMTGTPTAEAVIQGSQGNTVTFTIQMRGFDRAYAVLSHS